MQTILRYPGGKFKKAKRIIPYFNHTYLDLAEPMCGGAGVSLVYAEMNPNAQIILTDINRLVVDFWICVVFKADEFCNLLENSMNVEIYKKYHSLVPKTTLESAMKFFVLNKCSFNGYVGRGSVPIGGWGQTSKWGVDWCWKPEKLKNNIMKIHNMLEGRTTVACASVFDVIKILGHNPNYNFYIDPPYIEKGESLYGEYGKFDHKRLSQYIPKIAGQTIISYDYNPLVKQLYPDYRYEELSVFSSRRYLDPEKSKCLEQKEYLVIKDPIE